MSDFPGWTRIDVHVKRGDYRVGMGFVIGPRHVLTCAHVVATALGGRDQWIERREKPELPVTLKFAFSRAFPHVVEAQVVGWWPEYAVPENRSELDDVALLELPEGLDLPADVAAAVCGPSPLPDMEAIGHGVSEHEQYGVNFKGFVRGGVVGNRRTLRTEGGDDLVVPGCSGAGLLSRSGVIGMMAESQQLETGVFIPIDDLIAEQQIKAAWKPTESTPRSFVASMALKEAPARNAVAADEDHWTRMPVATRLVRYLHDCDRTQVFQPLEDFTFGESSYRQPVIGVFGSHDDDLPEHLFDRFQSHFLLEAKIYTPAEIARLPPKWRLDQTIWRGEGQRADEAFKMLKRRLMRAVGAESTEPSAIRDALGRGPSKTLYSELSAEALDEQDNQLLKLWSAYWAQIADLQPKQALVHLLCVKPAEAEAVDEKAFKKRVAGLVEHGHPAVVFNAGLLTCLDDRDLEDWLNGVAVYVPLKENEVLDLWDRVTRDLLQPDSPPPRLGKLRQWLTKLNQQEQ